MTDTLYFTTGDGFRGAYQLDGAEGLPALVLSNSIATNFHMWDPQIARLSESFRILRYDFRGHGASGVTSGAFSIDRLGHDVLELLDSLQIARAHFCGLSLGGFVGQWLGIHAPERIERLILSNTSAHLGPASYFNEQIRVVLASNALTSDTAACLCATGFRSQCSKARTRSSPNFTRWCAARPPKGLPDAMRRSATPICVARSP